MCNNERCLTTAVQGVLLTEFSTGRGKKLSNNELNLAKLALLLLSFPPFPVLNPTAPLEQARGGKYSKG